MRGGAGTSQTATRLLLLQNSSSSLLVEWGGDTGCLLYQVQLIDMILVNLMKPCS